MDWHSQNASDRDTLFGHGAMEQLNKEKEPMLTLYRYERTKTILGDVRKAQS